MSYEWRTYPSLTSLRAFDATARFGGFAGAARALNVTHAAVAQQVRALEAELGMRLAIRQGRTIQLTDEGKRLARQLSDAFQAISDEITAIREEATHRGLRVTTTPFLTDRLIVPRLSEFWDTHPGAEISLSPSRAYVDIVKEGFDLAIRAHPRDAEVDWTGTDVVKIASAELVAIAEPSLSEACDFDLQKVPWLRHDGMETKEGMMRACGVDVDHIEWVRIGSANLLLEAARQGRGATIFNGTMGRQEVARGGLVELPLPQGEHMIYYGVIPKGPRHPLVGEFIDWVKTLF